MPAKITYGFIGGGNICEALIQCALTAKIDGEELMVSDPKPERITYFENTYKIYGTCNNIDLVKQCTYIFLCVKPYTVKDVCQQISSFLTNNIIISLAAGVLYDHLWNWLSVDQIIIRCMPSLINSIGLGIVAFYSQSSKKDDNITKIFGKCKIIFYNDEKKLDGVTILSGCLPAYISYLAKSFFIIHDELGLTGEEAKELIIETFKGTGELLKSKTFDSIEKEVASKGGATEDGLKVMEYYKLNKIINLGVLKSYSKIRQITNNL